MRLTLRGEIEIFKAAFNGWRDDRAGSMGAAIAYYTVFSIAPILLLVIAIAGMIFGERAAQGALVDSLVDVMGKDGAKALETMIKNAAVGSSGPIATAIGFITLIVAASAVLTELQAALNVIWKVRAKSGVLHQVKHRAAGLSIILVGGGLLILELAAGAAITAFSHFLQDLHAALPLLLRALSFAITLVSMTIFFGLIFKIMPDAKVHWHDVWLGAVLTAILFGVGKHFISLYIGSRHVTSVYGAAGALVIVLLWVYYSTQILLMGAEITKARSDWRKKHETARAPAPQAAPAA